MFIWVQNHWHWFAGYLAAASTAGFLLMGSDKARAKKGSWRIPEKTFFGVALLGGTPGCLAGMYLFHHKTRHCGLDYPLYEPPLLKGSVMVLNISS